MTVDLEKHFLILKEVCEVKAYALSVDALAVDTASHPSLSPSFWGCTRPYLAMNV